MTSPIFHILHNRSTANTAPESKEATEKGSKVKGKASDAASPKKPKVPAPATEAVPAPPGQEEPDVVLEAKADLYLYDQASGLFMTQEKGVDVKVLEAGRFLCEFTSADFEMNSNLSYNPFFLADWLAITSSKRQWLSQQLESSMNMHFSAENASAVWNFYDTERHVYSWLIRFGDKASFDAFQAGFARLMWEALNEEKFEKVKEVEKSYIEEAYDDDVEMGNAEEEDREAYARDDEEAAEVAAELGDTSGRAEDEEDEENDVGNKGDNLAVMPIEAGDRDKNTQLTVGYKFDRSFVVRGNKIGVFKHTDDDQLEFATTINNVATPNGKAFNPRKVMLHDQDSSMVMMDPTNTHALYRMDLEYGKVVDEWKVHDDIGVDNVVPDSKYAQTTAQKTLIGHGHNSIYRIDPRLAGQKLVDSQFKLYTTKNDFSSAATDSSGRLAVASNKGDIRLFDQIGKNAKTALPALGDPIIGVDVTADGRYVIATCKTYLLLIDTLIGDGRYKGSLGFDRAFPSDSKPIPRRLQLKPHHVAYMDEEVSFTPARFDTPPDGGETSIVSATGSYIVSWPMEKVKRGRTDVYTLRKLGDTVVEDNFAFGSSSNIIVAMPQDLQMHRKAQLKKPTRTSLMEMPRYSRSSVVDERY